ncbi:MAG: hypothetical protein K2P17_06485 [Helicobacteraceae bacterium]|nr:hypothetical protein [Helicobacteraceae bacterium]
MFKKVLIFGVMVALFSACSDDKAKNNINYNANSANSNIELKAESNATIESSLNMQDSNATLSKSESSSTLTAMESKNMQENSNKAGNGIANADSTSSENTTTNAANANTNTKSAESLYKKCIACHGAKGEKTAPGSVGGVLIGNLSKDSIIESLKGYRAKTLSKGGTYAVMYLQANNLSDEDIEILGEYIDSFN